MTHQDLTRFIKLAGQDGHYNSSSEFTVDQVGALRKLGRYQAERADYWLLKLVQFANLSGASSCDFKLGRSETEVTLHGGSYRSAAEILAGIATISSTPDPLLDALRALCLQEGVVLDLETKGQKGAGRLRFSASGGLSEMSPSLETEGLHLCVKRSVAWKNLRSILKRRRDEHQGLIDFAWVSPVPIFLDKRRLEPRFSHLHPEERAWKIKQSPLSGLSLLHGGVPALPGKAVLKMVEVEDEELREKVQEGPWRVHLRHEWFVQEERGYCRLRPGIPLGSYINIKVSRLFRVNFVCEGVLIDSFVFAQKEPASTVAFVRHSLELFLPVSLSDTDLGGFRVRQAEQTALEGLSSALPYALNLSELYCKLQETFRLPGPFPRQEFRRAEKISSAAGGLLALGCATLGTGAVLPTLAGITALSAAGGYLPGWALRQQAAFFKPTLKLLAVIKESLLHCELDLKDYADTSCRDVAPATVGLTAWSLWPEEGPYLPAGFWAVSLVQAGVAWQCEGVEFTFLKDEVCIRWRNPKNFALPSWRDTLSQSLSRADRGARHLLVGLRNLALLPLDSLEISDSSTCLRWTAEHFEEIPQSSSSELKLVIRSSEDHRGSFLAALRRKARSGSRIRLDALSRIQEHCWLSPIPVSIDTVQLQDRYAFIPRRAREVFQQPMQWRIPLCMARCDLAVGHGLGEFDRPFVDRSFESGEHWAEGRLTLPATDYRFHLGAEETLGAILTLTGGLRADSCLEFVHDGALIDRLPLYHPDDFQEARKEVPTLSSLSSLKTNYPRIALRAFISVDDEDLVGPLEVRDKFSKAGGLVAALSPLLDLVEPLCERLAQLDYRFPAKAVGEDEELSGIVFRLELQARYRFSKKKRKKELMESLRQFPEFIAYLLEQHSKDCAELER